MSIDIKYVSNGKKALYYVMNTGVTPNTYTTCEKLEDIPESIRHYAPKGDPKVIDPDTAQFLGLGPALYPEYENRCMYNGFRAMACVGPGCLLQFIDNPIYCPYWIKDKEEKADV